LSGRDGLSRGQGFKWSYFRDFFDERPQEQHAKDGRPNCDHRGQCAMADVSQRRAPQNGQKSISSQYFSAIGRLFFAMIPLK
jgi:hypothetical protein